MHRPSRNPRRSSHRGGPLGQPAFRRFWTSRLLTNIGSFAQIGAIAWIVLREDGGPLHLGVVLAIATLPVGLFALAGGAFADRYALRPFVVVLELGLAVNAGVLAILEVSGQLTLWEISAAGAISGTLGAFAAPGVMRMTRGVVSQDDLPAAIALGSVGFNVARIAGPALGGVLIAVADPGLCFGVNAVSYLVFALVAARVPLRRQPPRVLRLSLRRGLRGVRSVSPLTTVAGVLAPIGLLGLNLTAFASIVGDTVLGVGEAGFGLVMTAAGVGALVAGLTLAARNRLGLRTFLLGALILSGGLILIAATSEIAVVAAGFFVFGIGMSTSLASANTLFQGLAPPDAEGTALGVFNLLTVGTTPVGSLLVGALAAAAGIQVAIACLGAGCLVAVATGAAVAYRRRQLAVEVSRGVAAR